MRLISNAIAAVRSALLASRHTAIIAAVILAIITNLTFCSLDNAITAARSHIGAVQTAVTIATVIAIGAIVANLSTVVIHFTIAANRLLASSRATALAVVRALIAFFTSSRRHNAIAALGNAACAQTYLAGRRIRAIALFRALFLIIAASALCQLAIIIASHRRIIRCAEFLTPRRVRLACKAVITLFAFLDHTIAAISLTAASIRAAFEVRLFASALIAFF